MCVKTLVSCLEHNKCFVCFYLHGYGSKQNNGRNVVGEKEEEIAYTYMFMIQII